MCEKCQKRLADFKGMVENKDLGALFRFTDAVMGILIGARDRIMEICESENRAVHPAILGASMVYLGYIEMFRAASLRKEVSEEDLQKFTDALLKDVREGVVAAPKPPKIVEVSFESLPDDIKQLVKEIIGASKEPPKGGMVH